MIKIRSMIAVLFIVLVFTGIAAVLEKEKPEKLERYSGGEGHSDRVLINLQVDAENTGENLFKVLGELERRGYTTTVFVTGSFAKDNGIMVQQVRERGHDIAFHGWMTGEKLETMNLSMQKELLTRSKDMVENYSEYKIEGFRPQYYSQNEDTYAVLDELDVSYDSGFISGLKYMPGFENYSKPYKVTNHSFYAVPVSSYNASGKLIYLCDLSASSKFKINATEWSSILKNKFNESKEKNEPIVAVIHPWITGNETTGYWQAFTGFLNYTDENKIDIVKTDELLDFYVEGNDDKYDDSVDVVFSLESYLSRALQIYKVNQIDIVN